MERQKIGSFIKFAISAIEFGAFLLVNCTQVIDEHTLLIALTGKWASSQKSFVQNCVSKFSKGCGCT